MPLQEGQQLEGTMEEILAVELPWSGPVMWACQIAMLDIGLGAPK